MSLHSLVLCSDQKILRVLRRVLSGLEIGIQHCGDADSAIRELTRRRFEAFIVDCDTDAATQVLRSLRSAPCNKRAIAVAIIDGQAGERSTSALGAHFVVHEPISSEWLRNTFRAARALMKCERRRSLRLGVELPVTLIGGHHQHRSKTFDLGEGGMAIQLPRRTKNEGPMRIRFNLPGSEHIVECAAQLSWEGTGASAGLRFVDLSKEDRAQLRSWLASRSPEFEPPDPPFPCRLTDISPGGCYIEVTTPFPVGTRVSLATRVAGPHAQVEGRVMMRAETGMAIEFARTTEEQRRQLDTFIQTLLNSKGKSLGVEVEAEGPDDARAGFSKNTAEDPLLDFFRRSSEMTPEDFRAELRNLRRAPIKAMQAAVSA